MLAIGLLVGAGAMVWGWLQTTDKRLLYGAAVPLLLAVGVIVLDQLYESPEEQVRQALFAAADAIERDDMQATLDAFIPEAEKERAAIRSQFAIFKVSDISIKNNLTIEITRTGRRATAKFNVTAQVTHRSRGGSDFSRRIPRYFTVYFERDGKKWLIETFEEQPAETGFKRPDAR